MRLYEAKSIREYLDSKPDMPEEDREITVEILARAKDLIEDSGAFTLLDRYLKLVTLEDMLPTHLMVKKALRDRKEKDLIGTQMSLFN